MTLRDVQPDGRIREVRFIPGYDLREKPGNYGIHGMELHFLLRHRSAAPQWTVYFEAYTNWMPRTVQRNWKYIGEEAFSTRETDAYGIQVGYHSTVQLNEYQYSHDACDWLDGARCYCGSSGGDERKIFGSFVDSGEEAVWTELNRRADRLEQEIEQAISDARNFS